jgi:hypothetical protein
MNCYSSEFVFNHINEILDIDFDNTTDEETIDNKTVIKLEELWNSLDSKNYNLDFYKKISDKSKYTNYFLIDTILGISKNKLKNVSLEKNDIIFDILTINKIIIILKTYIQEIKLLNDDEMIKIFFIDDNMKDICKYLLLSIWCQDLVSNNNSISYPILYIICCYKCIEHYDNNHDDIKTNKFMKYCYKRLLSKQNPYCKHSKIINNLISSFEKKYPREKYLFIYNRIIYLLNLRINKKKNLHDIFLSTNIEKGYSIFDTLLYLILIDNTEENDQEKQNFFAIFGIFIKIIIDIKAMKKKKSGYFYTQITNGFNLDKVIIKLLNLIKIMYNYIVQSSFVKSKNKINCFTIFSLNFLIFSIYENSTFISSELLSYLVSISLLTPTQYFKIINKYKINHIIDKHIFK